MGFASVRPAYRFGDIAAGVGAGLRWLMVDCCPYPSLTRGGWIPAVVMWDPATGFFSRVEGPDAFTTWHEADEASRFLRADG